MMLRIPNIGDEQLRDAMKNMSVGDIKPKEDDDVQIIDPPPSSHVPQDEDKDMLMKTLKSLMSKRWHKHKMLMLPKHPLVGHFKRKQKNPQVHGYRCSFHPGVFQSIDFPQGT